MGEIRLTTTGTLSPVVIDDLGGRSFTHPTAAFNLLAEFTEDEVQYSADLQALLTAAHITLADENAVAITDVQEASPHKHEATDISNLAGADTDAIHDNVSAEISAITEKLTPVAADLIVIEDSAAANVKKRVQVGNLPGGGGGNHLGHFDANDATFPATDPAAASSRNGHPVLNFDDGATEERVVFNDVMSRDYSAGNVIVDVDWVAKTAVVGGVTWGIEIERDAPGGQDIDSDGFAAQQDGTSTTNATSGVVTRTTITLTQAQADSIAAGDAYRMRLERVTGDVGDDMVGDAQVLRVVVRQ